MDGRDVKRGGGRGPKRPLSARALVPGRRPATVAGAFVCLAWPLFLAGCASGRLPMVDPSGERLFVAGPVNRQPEPRPPRAHDLVRVELTPSKVVAPVGCEVVMIAGVCGADGYLRAREGVEWMLSPGGVGEFVTVGRRSPLDWLTSFDSGPRKVTNTYALGTTSSSYLCLNRGTPTADDDLPVERGQAWTAITSPVEGVSYVTAYAPGVKAWDSHRQTAKIYWIDAEFAYPPPAIGPAGTRHTLTTTVTRHSTHAPFEGWRVRYEITGGPPAGFAPNGGSIIEVPTNELGQASAEIYQLEATPGTNTVAIQVVRPADAHGEEFTVGQGTTLMTWSAAATAIRTTEPAQAPAGVRVTTTGPAQVTVGQDALFRAEIMNTGASPLAGLVIVDRYDAGLQHASRPGATDRAMERDLGALAPGETRTIDVTFRVVRAGRQCNTIDVYRAADLLGSGKACLTAVAPAAATTAGRPKLSITKSGPQRQQQGSLAIFDIAITNSGTAAATNLTVTDHAETPLNPTRASHDPKQDADGDLFWKVARLDVGQTIRFRVECQCLEPVDNACNRVTATSQEGVSETAESCLEITAAAPGLKVSIADEGDPVSIGKQTAYHITVMNSGAAPEKEVGVTVTVPEMTSLVAAGIKGPSTSETIGRTVNFAPVASLAPGQKLEFTVPVQVKAAGNGAALVDVTSQGRAAPVSDQATTTFIK